MIVKPTDPNAIQSILMGASGTKLDVLPTAVGHDSSPLAGWPHSSVSFTSHLVPEVGSHVPLTRQQRVAAWDTWLAGLKSLWSGTVKAPWLTIRGSTTAAIADPGVDTAPSTPGKIRY